MPNHTDIPDPLMHSRLAEAESVLAAIRHNEIDALVVEGEAGSRIYTLHSAEEPYRRLVEQMQEGAVVLTAEGTILYANTQFAGLVGVPLESLLGSRFNRFIAADRVDDFAAFLEGGHGRQRACLIGADGHGLDVSISLSITPQATGAHLNLIIADLTDLLEAQGYRHQAERDNRTKDEFLAMLAHELRTPLTAMSAAAELIWSKRANGVDAIRAHTVITRQIAHISHLVTDLLDVERVVSGKLRLNRQPLDLADMVKRATLGFTSNDQVRWTLDITAEAVWVEVDEVRIEQVLTNLLNNALKYTSTGGQITVAVHAVGAEVCLSVEDTGLGISARLLPFIFDLYTQADRTIDHAEGGLGIGLTLVRRIVELHGGTVEASSAGEGHGTAFTVRLNRIPPVARAASSAPQPDRRAAPRRVLLIEDNQDAREMLRTVLELAGHVVYDAPDGVRGLELWNRLRPDVGIIDIDLPIMDGYQVASRIRNEPEGRSMLLLALSGNEARGNTGPGGNGFDHHLVKPLDLDDLTRLLGVETDRE